MTASAVASFGIALKYGNAASPEVFTAYAELLGIDGVSLEHLVVDSTSHDSSNNARDFISGKLTDAGEVTFQVQLIPTNAGHKGIITDMYAGTRRNFQLVFPDSGATTWAFTALIRNFSISADLESPLQADITLKISGKPTFPA